MYDPTLGFCLAPYLFHSLQVVINITSKNCLKSKRRAANYCNVATNILEVGESIQVTHIIGNHASTVATGVQLHNRYFTVEFSLSYIYRVIHMHPLDCQQSSQCVLLILVVDWKEGIYTCIYFRLCTHITYALIYRHRPWT